jgi:hypothetical protein
VRSGGDHSRATGKIIFIFPPHPEKKEKYVYISSEFLVELKKAI